MAEKYGTIPPKFTKEWWDHFWTYYKWYALVPLFIVVAVVITIMQTSSSNNFDIMLTYAGKNVYTLEDEEQIKSELSPLCDDLNENGEKTLSFTQYNFTGAPENIEVEGVLGNKVFLALSEEESFIFIMDAETADRYAGDEEVGSMFAPLGDWLQIDYSDKGLYSKNGVNYGIKVSDSPVFQNLGINFENQYLFIRFYPRTDQLDKFLKGYESAIKLANKLYEE